METESALNHSCTVGSKSFRERGHLLRHISMKHTFERPHRCSYCELDFKRSGHLRMHIRAKHQSERTTREAGDSADGPDQHPPEKHQVGEHLYKKSYQDVSPCEGFKCTHPGCPYIAKRNCDLQVHMVIHSSARPFGCSKCSSVFKRKDKLQRHHRDVHSLERPFECSTCGSKFKRRDRLRRHLRLVH